MNNRRERLLHMAQGALIAALYATLTVIFAPISFGPIQVRIAEALTVLPMFTSAAIPGLFIGCFIANLFGGTIIWDVIFGSLATFIGAAGGYRLRNNRWLVPIPTIIANGIIVPFVLKYGYGMYMPVVLMMLYVSAGEIVGCYVLGEILASALLKHRKFYKNLFKS